MDTKPVYAGIDIGAGLGAKFGLFGDRHQILAETLLEQSRYGGSAESMAEALAATLEQFLDQHGHRVADLRAVGIATPGLFKSDGACLLASNLPFLNGHNLPALLSRRLGKPVGIENDANAGGLAEWSVLRTELLYWVFGGGWGGAWISAEGEVRYSALDWDGLDAHLHYTNEPGYAIPIEKLKLRGICSQVGASWERLERILLEDFRPEDGLLTGPSGSPEHLRAEVLLSGPGRCRLFRTVSGDDDFYTRFLEIHEVSEMTDPSVAGKHISKLSSLRVEAAINTDRLFGKILAEATRVLLKQAQKDGLPAGVPICLGGKPAYALPYFGPSTQRVLGALGYMNYLRPSVLDERGSNANLVGACVVAQRAAKNAG
ncbi:MAG: ROK family protein [Spirochaetes bacterium]|nr:ROK family protein [Spirochaetota bacterium]